MAYMRGEYYIWDDESGFHLWAKDGYDGWDQTGWACSEEKEGARTEGYENASGVSIHEEIMDEFVVMRLTQIIHEGKVAKTIDRAIGPDSRGGGNGGGQMLKKNAAKIKEALAKVELDELDAEWWKQYGIVTNEG